MLCYSKYMCFHGSNLGEALCGLSENCGHANQVCLFTVFDNAVTTVAKPNVFGLFLVHSIVLLRYPRRAQTIPNLILAPQIELLSLSVWRITQFVAQK